MTPTASRSWESLNQASMLAELAALHRVLERFLGDAPLDDAALEDAALEDAGSHVAAVKDAPLTESADQEDRVGQQARPALDSLCAAFGLSDFERKILLMCAAVELDSRFAALYETAAESAGRGHRPGLPTFSLALAALEDAHWSALLPDRPLRRWRLIEVLPGDALTTSPLRIDERILHYLAGMRSIDERLRPLAAPIGAPGALTSTQQEVALRIVDALAHGPRETSPPAVQLSGGDAESRRMVAAGACARMGLNLHAISAHAVPRGATEIDLFLRLWEREAALQPGALLLEYDDAPALEAAGEYAAKCIVETLRGPLLISTRDRINPVERGLISLEVPPPAASEQVEAWYRELGAAAPAMHSEVEALVAQFSLSAGRIAAAVAAAAVHVPPPVHIPPEQHAHHAGKGSTHAFAAALWDACRMQSRGALEGLAQRIEPAATWDDLVLPEQQKRLLAQVELHVRQRAKVYRSWGFASRGERGLGISALFSGASGTGKTMAAEVLANQLRLDLYRIDLSQTISKYIGETEKNLRRVFDAAEESAAILLFDEADALFGRRSEVKDSHDRYANIEVSYLLQRMEAYRGLAILTTNRRDALDSAFLRRIRFAVDFPFPQAAQRAEIWQRIFPRQTPTEGLRIDRLARLSAAGGNIQNIAMGAAFLAADAGEPVRMSHLLAAARTEFTKIERPLTESETAGWV
jgi:hypothetical protein